MPASYRPAVQPRGSTPAGLGDFERRAQLLIFCTDLEVASVGKDLVLPMGGHQGAIAGATLQGRSWVMNADSRMGGVRHHQGKARTPKCVQGEGSGLLV